MGGIMSDAPVWMGGGPLAKIPATVEKAAGLDKKGLSVWAPDRSTPDAPPKPPTVMPDYAQPVDNSARTEQSKRQVAGAKKRRSRPTSGSETILGETVG